MDYMPGYANAIVIPYRLVPYSEPTNHYQDLGQTWADPDIDAAAEALRRIHTTWCANRPVSTPTYARRIS